MVDLIILLKIQDYTKILVSRYLYAGMYIVPYSPARGDFWKEGKRRKKELQKRPRQDARVQGIRCSHDNGGVSSSGSTAW